MSDMRDHQEATEYAKVILAGRMTLVDVREVILEVIKKEREACANSIARVDMGSHYEEDDGDLDRLQDILVDGIRDREWRD